MDRHVPIHGVSAHDMHNYRIFRKTDMKSTELLSSFFAFVHFFYLLNFQAFFCRTRQKK